MPEDPTAADARPPADTRDLMDAERDAGHRAPTETAVRAGTDGARPGADDAPEVGLSQKGSGEAAVVRRETQV